MPKGDAHNGLRIIRAVRRRIDAVLSPTTLGLGCLVLLLSLIGFMVQQDQEASGHWDQALFKAFQLLTLQSGTEGRDNVFLVAARLGALVLVCLVAWKALALLLRDSTDAWRLARPRGHTVVCGLGRIGMQVLEDIIRQGSARNVVVIESDEENQNLRRARELNAVVVIGDATDNDTLSKAHVARARKIFAVTGSDDSNIETTVNVCKLMAGESDPLAASPPPAGDVSLSSPPREQPPAIRLNCYTHILDPKLAELIQQHPVFRNRHDEVEIHAFNVTNNAAWQLIVDRVVQRRPVAQDQVAHYVILGFGAMGECLALHLVQLAHFANMRRCRMSIFAANCREAELRFRSRYPRFMAVVSAKDLNRADPDAESWSSRIFRPAPDLQITGPGVEYVSNAVFGELPLTIVDENFIAGLKESLAHPFVKPAIFVCLPQDRDNFDTAVRLHDRLRMHRLDEIPIYAWIPRQPALAELLESDVQYSRALFAFGECRHSASLGEVTHPTREHIAQALHEDYRKHFCPAGDSRPACRLWRELDESYRASNRAAADHAVIKLAATGLCLKQQKELERGETPVLQAAEGTLDVLARMEHNRWITEKLLTGWRYDHVRNNDQRKHPDLVPWESLSDASRDRDRSQVSVLFRVLNDPPYAIIRKATS